MPASTIDWQAIHRRLAAAADASSAGFHQGPEETQRILEARARAAAKPAVKPDDAVRLEILAFALAGETYGVETCYIREVCALKDLTTVPCTPPFVAGVMNLRGRILAIIDLRKFFELPAKGLTELNRIIVLREGDDEFGLLADSIERIRSVAVPDRQAGLPTLTGRRERFFKGVTDEMLTVLDGARLLADADLKVNEQTIK